MVGQAPEPLRAVPLSTCVICGAQVRNAYPVEIGDSFTDIDVLLTSRAPGHKSGVICPACGTVMRIESFNPRATPSRSVGYIFDRHGFYPIPWGVEGLEKLANPPEPPFVVVLGRWEHERHVLLRAQVALDRSVYPVLMAPFRRKIVPFHLFIGWLSAEKVKELAAYLKELGQKEIKPFQLLSGMVKKEDRHLLKEFWARFDYPWVPYLIQAANAGIEANEKNREEKEGKKKKEKKEEKS